MLSIKSNSIVERHRTPLKLLPIMIGELYFIKKLLNPIYIFENGVFVPVITNNVAPTKEEILSLIKKKYKEVFVYEDDFKNIRENLQKSLMKLTRSLSVGDPLINGVKEIQLLTVSMGNFYKNPLDEEALMLQFQCSQNLANFLLNNKKYHSTYFSSLSKENFHFTLVQPMLSSIMMLSFIQSLHMFNDKEIETLFLTSYFKDVGMGLIPSAKYDIKDLTLNDKELLANHAEFSTDLLKNRVPLTKNYLTIINNHHFLNERLKNLIYKKPSHESNSDIIYGVESLFVSVFDIFVAMTSDRPFRQKLSPYKALELIKLLMADEYSQEYRALVNFLNKFYKI